MDNKERIAAFLAEYRDLCQRHGLFVNGCGCCDSPFLSEVSTENRLDSVIDHLRKEAANA